MCSWRGEIKPKSSPSLAVLAASLILSGCADKAAAPRGVDFSKDYSSTIAPMIASISESDISRSIGDLCAIPSREIGESGCDEARDYLIGRFKEYGWKVSTAVFHPMATTAYNVIAEWPGADDGRAVIVSAHYDSWGDGHSGAVDNASGCAGLVSIAGCVSTSSAKFHRTIRLIAFSSEEHGQAGSKDYVKTADPKRILVVLNLDAIAPIPKEREALVYHYRYADWEVPLWLPRMLASITRRYQESTGIRSAPYWDGSGYSFDSRAFEVVGIPALSIVGIGDTPANTLRDTIDKVDAAYGRDLTRFAAAAALTLAGPIAPKRP
jgi:Zn-dependent M28 family amino/carboxypeptidase